MATGARAFGQGGRTAARVIRSNQPVRFDTINGCGDDECLANAMLHDIAYYSARERVRTTEKDPRVFTLLPLWHERDPRVFTCPGHPEG